MYKSTFDEFVAVLTSYRHDPVFQLKLINLRIQKMTEVQEPMLDEGDSQEYMEDLQKLNEVYAKIYTTALDLRALETYIEAK